MIMNRSTKHLIKNITTFYIPEIKHKLQFDGCSKGNPGLSGSGAVIYEHDKEIWCDSLFVGNNETNNFAEYTGLIMGLKKAYELNIKDLFVEGDSMLVIKQMKGEYKVSSEKLLKKYTIAKNYESKFDSVYYNHIYRKYNTRSDELANIAVDEQQVYMKNLRDDFWYHPQTFPPFPPLEKVEPK